MLCAKFGWNWLSGSGEVDFLILSIYFSLFRNYLPLEKGRAILLNSLNPLHPRTYFAKFGWNWPSGSGEEDFGISSIYFCLLKLSPLEKGLVLHLDKLKFPSPKDALCQVLLKLDQWFLRRKLISSMYFCYFVIISPWKRA